MPYSVLATSQTPALIIYLLDISASMSMPLGSQRRIDVVIEALSSSVRHMVFRSTRGQRIAPRYRLAIYAYSENVFDVLGGVRSVDEVARIGIPELAPMATTATAKGLHYVERLLDQELPGMADCPAPVVCHMTDGVYTGDDPLPSARRSMARQVADGPVLMANIYLAPEINELTRAADYRSWPGITDQTELQPDSYLFKLRQMSSRLPASYQSLMRENGFHIGTDAYMLIPGSAPQLVAMGFQMAASTPVRVRP